MKEPEKIIEDEEVDHTREPLPDTELDIEVLELEENPYSDETPTAWWWNL